MNAEWMRRSPERSGMTKSKRMRLTGAACGVLSVVGFLACGDANREDFGPPPPPLPEPSQPPEGEACVEAFAETRRAVDIIMSIDQSWSMAEEVASLQENVNLLPTLLAETGLDYRVVMMAAIRGAGKYGVCVPPPLGGPDCSANGNIFRPVDYLVDSRTTLDQLLMTFDHPVSKFAWRDVLRPGVLKVFVPITDDDSSLSGKDFDADLLLREKALFGTPSSRNYIFFPVIGSNDFPADTLCLSASAPGYEYQYLATLTNGKWFSVCRPSLKPVLEEIGKATREAISCEVAVPEPPADATLDFDRINVRITPKDGSPVVVPQDPSRPCTEGADGWQFSEDKKKILLCGSACDLVKSDPAAKFNVGFGCNTVIR